ncbi:NADP-dependent oxidoreductase [Vineibacter terrae]|uniref:NADP-dependent oxidoreductase n=1 Tax=Vineibacter terrae TaxID=2586908 RepID=A0A5C8PN72_9HYPH|nr:NADP-dependent oxidoreductase [Vineibacter terrae]TXL76018.1 NADP-dependent oxidoreductase [Vineibacter terrae]
MPTPRNLENRRVVLAARPVGIPQAAHFALEAVSVPEPADGQVLVRNRYLSVDPAMRGWVNVAANYAPPVPVGEVMRSFAAGEVIASASRLFKAGDLVTGMFGWQQYAVVDAQTARAIPHDDLPLSAALGVLGLNGVTAYWGLLGVGQPRPGDTVVVSTAAGAVGSAVGQIARLKGCRTVGIAGGADKVRQCREIFGFDAAIDYKAGDLAAALDAACPRGVDVYFDNTSGPISDAVLSRLAVRARVVICGTASIASWEPWPSGPRIERHLLVKRARAEGFLLFDWMDRYDEAVQALAAWVRDGQLRYQEHVLKGLASAPDAIAMLYRGENQGKLLIEIE